MAEWYTCLRRQARNIEMFYVYVLKSLANNWYYIGLTTDPIKRLKQHNIGGVSSTKSKSPFNIIYKKKFDNRVKARDFEKFLKIRSNKEKILKRLGYI